MSLEDRKKQGKTLARLLWTGLTGTLEEVQAIGVEAYEDVRDQIRERRSKRVLNEGHRVEPADPERRRQ
jgi:hypothetical protein